MELTEDETIEKDATQCVQCIQNTLLPDESDFTCFACVYNLFKRKIELTRVQP